MIAGTETLTIVASTMIIATPRLSIARPSHRPRPDSSIEAGAGPGPLVIYGPPCAVIPVGMSIDASPPAADDIIPLAAEQPQIVARTAVQVIVAGPSEQRVVVVAALDDVVAGVALDPVATGTAGDRVVPGVAAHFVLTSAGVDPVAFRLPPETSRWRWMLSVSI